MTKVSFGMRLTFVFLYYYKTLSFNEIDGQFIASRSC